jgi:hypothetical protein
VCTSVRAAKETADVVVVSVHWGLLEDRVAIGDYQREAARAYIDAGADLNLGHGTLVTKGIEIYKGKVVFYSLGKFLMKGPRPTADVPIGVNAAVGIERRKGLAAVVQIEGGAISRVAFAPTFADQASRPAFIAADHERFGEIAGDVQAISKAAGLTPATFTLDGNLVVIS